MLTGRVFPVIMYPLRILRLTSAVKATQHRIAGRFESFNNVEELEGFCLASLEEYAPNVASGTLRKLGNACVAGYRPVDALLMSFTGNPGGSKSSSSS